MNKIYNDTDLLPAQKKSKMYQITLFSRAKFQKDMLSLLILALLVRFAYKICHFDIDRNETRCSLRKFLNNEK